MYNIIVAIQFWTFHRHWRCLSNIVRPTLYLSPWGDGTRDWYRRWFHSISYCNTSLVYGFHNAVHPKYHWRTGVRKPWEDIVAAVTVPSMLIDNSIDSHLLATISHSTIYESLETVSRAIMAKKCRLDRTKLDTAEISTWQYNHWVNRK